MSQLEVLSWITHLVVIIEMVGAIILCAYLLQSLFQSLRHWHELEYAQVIAANGVVIALDYKLAATVLKTLALNGWQQIAAFVAILSIRIIVKRQMAWQMAKFGSKTQKKPA